MIYDDLTDKEKSDLHAHEIYLRGNCNHVLRLIHLLDKNTWDEFIEKNIQPILEKLDDNAVIPNTSGLTNAQDFTAADYKDLKTKLASLYDLQQSFNHLIVAAGGTGNT